MLYNTCPFWSGYSWCRIRKSKSATCHSDTLFSALCNEALLVYGQEKLEHLKQYADAGNLLLTDTFPFQNNTYYLPKPATIRLGNELVNHEKQENSEGNSKLKKKVKKIKYIRSQDWGDYLENSQRFSPDELDVISSMKDIYDELHTYKVSVSRFGEDSEPYMITSYVFKENAGLYFILKADHQDVLENIEKLMNSLELSGIGGERSSGYGKFKFQLVDVPLTLKNILDNESLNGYIALSLISPQTTELTPDNLKESAYTLARREGFIWSTTYQDTLVKRKPVTMFNTGSFFKNKLEGQVLNLQDKGSHPVYRYGKAFMVGV